MRLSYLLFLGLFASCSHRKLVSSKPTPFVDQVEKSINQSLVTPTVSNDQVNLAQSSTVEKTPANKHQIRGVSKTSKGYGGEDAIYFLYGAEHLKLKNNYFDIPVVYNTAVKTWIDYFMGRGRDYFIRYTQRSGRYAPILGKILEAHDLPRDLIFLAMAESGFHNMAKSWAKAVGPWQFMPYTGKVYGLHRDWYVDERRDPIKSTIAAAKYLGKLKERFGSWELAAAAYNAGEGKVSRAIKRYKTQNFWELRKGRYFKRETKNYVPKIMALAIIGKNLASFGLGGVKFDDPLDFDEVELLGNSDLVEVAKALDLPFEELQKYNPEILRWQTPPYAEKYKLRLPTGYKQKWQICCAEKKFLAYDYQTYRIRGSRASLKAVANKFRISYKILSELNPELVIKTLRRNDAVRLPFRVGQEKRDPMYADLYERPVKRIRRARRHKRRIRTAMRSGRLIRNPSAYYVVKKGDTLWEVSKKVGTPLNTLIRSNSKIVLNRRIRAGDRLVIR